MVTQGLFEIYMAHVKMRRCFNKDIRNALLVKLHLVHGVRFSDLADMFHIQKRYAKKIVKDQAKLGVANEEEILSEL